MTFSQKAVEAAWKAYQDTPIDLLADSDEETKRCVVNALTAALAVDGVALVPKEPTDYMVRCGEDGGRKAIGVELSQEGGRMFAAASYRAMLAAASDREERR